MIQLEITSLHFALDSKTKNHVKDKIGGLDLYLGHKVHGDLTAHVILGENKGSSKGRFACEVTLNLPGRRLVAKEMTPLSMMVAIDRAEAKLKTQLTRYKSRREAYQHRLRSVIRRFRRNQTD